MEELGRPVGPEQGGREMAGERKAELAARDVDDAIARGRERGTGEPLEGAVDVVQDGRRVAAFGREPAQGEPAARHVGDRRQTVPDDVPDRDTEPVVTERDRRVPVAADVRPCG